jgi:hypothetical protein
MGSNKGKMTASEHQSGFTSGPCCWPQPIEAENLVEKQFHKTVCSFAGLVVFNADAWGYHQKNPLIKKTCCQHKAQMAKAFPFELKILTPELLLAALRFHP